MGPLTDLTSDFLYIKLRILDLLGPLAPTVTVVGQILMAMMAIFLLAAGRGFWAPPIPTLKNIAVRVAGLIAGVGLVALHVWSKDESTNFLLIAGWLIAGALLTLLVYVVVRQMLVFDCEGDPRLFVRGVWLQRNARRVLNGETANLPADYNLDGAPTPRSPKAYFCRTNKEPSLIWTDGSLAVSHLILLVSYIIFMVPLTLAISSAAYALQKSEVTVVDTANETRIDVPADILFAFNEWKLRPAAVASLQEVAEIMRQHKARAARIDGHTDSIGTIENNMDLSLRRAESVRTWLVENSTLSNLSLMVRGAGEAEPVADDKNADGSDNPRGRAQNRRVEIVIER